MTGAVILASQPFRPPDNGHQLELLSPACILESALKPFFSTNLEQIVVVLGHDYHHILNGMKALPSNAGVVIHRKPERGLGSALAVGLQALKRELQEIIVARGDQIIETSTIELLLEAARKEEEKMQGKKRVIVPLYHGKRGFPWMVSSELRDALGRLERELTLEPFLKSFRKDVLTLPVESRQQEKERSHE